jgi:hypothetical protein
MRGITALSMRYLLPEIRIFIRVLYLDFDGVLHDEQVYFHRSSFDLGC